MKKHDDVQHLIVKLLTLPGAQQIVQNHRWAHEGDRCHELLTSLLFRAIRLPEREVRFLANRLRFVGLMEVSEWASGEDEARTLKKRALNVLKEAGVKAEDAVRAVAVLQETSEAIQKAFDGKVQRFLRKVGYNALTDLLSALSLKTLPKAQTKEALAFWLQNVAALPVSLGHESAYRFCRAHGMDGEKLLQSADELDLNVAVLDDLIQQYERLSAESGTNALDAQSDSRGSERKE
jgi:hypothetical protein